MINVREALPRDLDAIVEIADRCGLSFWSAHDYLKEMEREDSVFFVAESSHANLVGFILGRIISAGVQSEAEIYNIGVSADTRRSGIGSELLTKFVSVVRDRGTKVVYLEVRSMNTHAISFYASHGFQRTYVRRSYYTAPNDDAVVLRLDCRNLPQSR